MTILLQHTCHLYEVKTGRPRISNSRDIIAGLDLHSEIFNLFVLEYKYYRLLYSFIESLLLRYFF